MKKISLVLIVLVILSAVSFAAVTSKPTRMDTENRQIEFSFYDDGKVVATATYDLKNNKISRTGRIPDGAVKEYDNKGILTYDLQYKNNKCNGPFTEYYENGTVRSKGSYKEDKLDGKVREFNEDGSLLLEKNYKNGMLNGDLVQYYDNGKVLGKASYKDNVPSGSAKTYYYNGTLRNSVFFKNGKLNGDEMYYWEDGKVVCKIIWKDDKRMTGTSLDVPIVISATSEDTGVSIEYVILRNIYGAPQDNWESSQKLIQYKGKPYDQLDITFKNGIKESVFFEISSFYGKF